MNQINLQPTAYEERALGNTKKLTKTQKIKQFRNAINNALITNNHPSVKIEAFQKAAKLIVEHSLDIDFTEYPIILKVLYLTELKEQNQ